MSSRGVSNDEIQRRAQVRLKKAEQRRIDAEKALASQKSLRAAEEAKTQRLRALRLAKEAEEAAAAAVNPKAIKKARPKKAAARP